MNSGLFILLFNTPTVGTDTALTKSPLEIMLQDIIDYETYCPEIEWKAPSIEVYEKTLKSQLPKECKNE